jgi:hypothetical protein
VQKKKKKKRERRSKFSEQQWRTQRLKSQPTIAPCFASSARVVLPCCFLELRKSPLLGCAERALRRLVVNFDKVRAERRRCWWQRQHRRRRHDGYGTAAVGRGGRGSR